MGTRLIATVKNNANMRSIVIAPGTYAQASVNAAALRLCQSKLASIYTLNELSRHANHAQAATNSIATDKRRPHQRDQQHRLAGQRVLGDN